MIDTHAHLNIDEYKNNIDSILKRAKDKGVEKIIVIGMDLKTSVRAVDLSKNHEELMATVGLHPAYVDDEEHDDLNYLYSDKRVVAVGEIGLDYHWRKDNKIRQEKVFNEQLQKAIILGLPVIIHTRNSYAEAYEIVKKYEGQIKGVFHCFSGNLEDAVKTVDMGFYIGIDGPVTFKNNELLIEIVKKIPLNKILIETDSPYLTPVPYRGKINEPANVYYVAAKIAQIKGISLDDVIKQTTNNAIKLFKLEEVK